jgi:CheY-like chemotaxis protein
LARGRADGPPEDVPLPALLARVGHLTAPRWRDAAQVEGREIALTIEAEPDAVISGWPACVREGLVNLVFNAIDALPEGGTIRLRALRQGEAVVVEVQDSGVGMSPEVRARIFEPLFTTKGPRGTGLGLVQVLDMAARHGARLAVDSAPGRGTTFRLAFPVPAAPAVVARPAGALSILVVDDEPPLADLLARMLRLDGHAVTVVHSGIAALDHLGTAAVDVVFSDMHMPGMTGWELTGQVHARHPTIPIVIASGWGSQITPDEARERGIHAVVPKPYRRADIQDAIAVLGRAQGAP